MSKNQRHLYGDLKDVDVPILATTVVEKGDLMFIMKTDSTITDVTTANGTGYPASSLQAVTATYYADQFAGVAMKGSVSGVTENVPVATAGVFRFPLPASADVAVGEIVSGATSAAKVAYDQMAITKTTATKIVGTTIGKCIKTETDAENVDVQIITRFSGVTYAEIN